MARKISFKNLEKIASTEDALGHGCLPVGPPQITWDIIDEKTLVIPANAYGYVHGATTSETGSHLAKFASIGVSAVQFYKREKAY
jgi:hypothetical protein